MLTVYNKVMLDSTTIINILDTTHVVSDGISGKYFYGVDGVKTFRTAASSEGRIYSKERTPYDDMIKL